MRHSASISCPNHIPCSLPMSCLIARKQETYIPVKELQCDVILPNTKVMSLSHDKVPCILITPIPLGSNECWLAWKTYICPYCLADTKSQTRRYVHIFFRRNSLIIVFEMKMFWMVCALKYIFVLQDLTMMTSSNGRIFRVTGHVCGEFTGPRWMPRTKASDAELWCFLWSASE